MNNPAMPSMEFLLSCSKQSLFDLELAALNRQSNCLKAAKLQWEEAARQAEVAGIARLMIEEREKLLETARRTITVQTTLEFPQVRRSA